MTNFDAFTAGVEPGGLRSKNDIRILVCYILQSVKAPLSADDIAEIMQQKSLANYFEVGDAIASLLRHENIRQDETGCYTICETGSEIAENLDTALPLSVRDKALEAALSMLARAKTERENKVTIERGENGFQVTCHISGGKMDLMTISLYVPEEKQAKMVKRNFHDNPLGIYELLLATLTGDHSFLQANR